MTIYPPVGPIPTTIIKDEVKYDYNQYLGFIFEDDGGARYGVLVVEYIILLIITAMLLKRTQKKNSNHTLQKLDSLSTIKKTTWKALLSVGVLVISIFTLIGWTLWRAIGTTFFFSFSNWLVICLFTLSASSVLTIYFFGHFINWKQTAIICSGVILTVLVTMFPPLDTLRLFNYNVSKLLDAHFKSLHFGDIFTYYHVLSYKKLNLFYVILWFFTTNLVLLLSKPKADQNNE